jgi:3-methyladenine DNA glycosylase AlkD
MPSAVTERARAFVDDHVAEARGLGESLAELIDEPESFERALREGLQALADPDHFEGVTRVAPGDAPHIGVRWPLWRAVARQLRRPLYEASPASSISLAQRLAVSPLREVRLFATVPLERSLPDDPERSWQLLRRLVRASTSWIDVDTCADLFALGVVLEPVRWAELEQLVYSRSAWERRLVGSSIARLPYQVASQDRRRLAAFPALMLIESLLGDAEPLVQKSLSWAIREWTRIDPDGVTRLLRREATIAAELDDGHRAWVIRDVLSHLPRDEGARLRGVVASVRRRADAPSTSAAGRIADDFQGVLAGADAVAGMQGDRMTRARG